METVVSNAPERCSRITVYSTGSMDPPWVAAEGWQGHMNEFNFIEFGKTPYGSGENGGIRGHVVYSQMHVQAQWEPFSVCEKSREMRHRVYTCVNNPSRMSHGCSWEY